MLRSLAADRAVRPKPRRKRGLLGFSPWAARSGRPQRMGPTPEVCVRRRRRRRAVGGARRRVRLALRGPDVGSLLGARKVQDVLGRVGVVGFECKAGPLGSVASEGAMIPAAATAYGLSEDV
eukprot:328424-Chlamydomonas_euryale.AAC.1